MTSNKFRIFLAYLINIIPVWMVTRNMAYKLCRLHHRLLDVSIIEFYEMTTGRKMGSRNSYIDIKVK